MAELGNPWNFYMAHDRSVLPAYLCWSSGSHGDREYQVL